MEGSIPKHCTQRSFSSPVSPRNQFDFTYNVEFAVVYPKGQAPVQMVLDEFPER
jgi:hypothetical protein